MLNRVTLMGRLTRDPELRRTQGGTAVCSFSIAADRDYKGADGEKATDYFDIVAWRASAEFVCRYFSKGRVIIVDGRLQSRKWTDKDGNKRTSIEIVADNFYFGDSKRDDGGGQPQSGYGAGGYQQGYGQYAPQEPPPYGAGMGYGPGATTGGFTEIEDDGELPF